MISVNRIHKLQNKAEIGFPNINQFEYILVQYMKSTEETSSSNSTKPANHELSSQQRLQRQTFASSPIRIELTTAMRSIVSQIRQNSLKRIKRFKQEEANRKSYIDQTQGIIRILKMKNKSSLKNTLSEQEIITLISLKRIHMETIICSNQQKRKNAMDLIDKIRILKINRASLQKSLQQKQKCNKYESQQLKKYRYLRQNHLQTTKTRAQIEDKFIQLSQQLQIIHQQTQQYSENITNSITKVDLSHKKLEQLNLEYENLSLLIIQQSKKKIPNQQQMINCMFEIGILKEQIFVLCLQKKEKTNLKMLHLQDKPNKHIRIYDKLARRTSNINGKDSQIIPLAIITAIYIHSKSLILNNLASTMNILSFFSEQFKPLYSYKSFQRYITAQMEKMRFNSEWQKIKSSIQVTMKQLPIFKKQLQIITNQACQSIIKDIFSLFELNDGYYINIGNLRMKLRLIEQTSNNQEKCEVKDTSLNHSEKNQLYIMLEI